jgi:hypothetical protein
VPFVMAGGYLGGAGGVLAGHMIGGIVFGVIGVMMCYAMIDKLAARVAEGKARGP